MFCENCGAELSAQSNFCPYCGTALKKTTTSISLLNKAASTAKETNEFNLVLVSRGTCDAVMAGDLLEDVFGYTDAESGNLVRMAPVVVGENMTAQEAATVAQMFTEYGMQVSITNKNDQYVDLTSKATSSVFDSNGSLLAGAAAIIGALTVANRISSYRRFKKPSLLERIFHIGYKPAPPPYKRNFRPRLEPKPLAPRRTIRRPPQSINTGSRGIFGDMGHIGPSRSGGSSRSSGHNGPGGHSGPGKAGGPSKPGSHSGPGGRR